MALWIQMQLSTQYMSPIRHHEIGRLVQERRNSIANALELCLFCTNPSKWHGKPYDMDDGWIYVRLWAHKDTLNESLLVNLWVICGLSALNILRKNKCKMWLRNYSKHEVVSKILSCLKHCIACEGEILVHIGSNYGFVPDSTNTLTNLVLMWYQWNSVAFPWGNFSRKYTRYSSLKCA